MSNEPKDPNRLVAISLPAATWREIEKELRDRKVWWLANQLVNTNSPVFREDS
jgi:hypothetical protein